MTDKSEYAWTEDLKRLEAKVDALHDEVKMLGLNDRAMRELIRRHIDNTGIARDDDQ